MILTLEEGSKVIHLVKEVKCERGVRVSTVKCGKKIHDDANTEASEWTAWDSRVTCKECRP